MIKDKLIKILREAGVKSEIIELEQPPKPEMGDLSFACFDLAKKIGKNPGEVASELVAKIERLKDSKIIERMRAVGPYVNFTLNSAILAEMVLSEIVKQKQKYGQSKIGQGKKIMVEFAHPNTHKAFHIGHLRNIITGESLVRIFENAGYKVIRANYQGDIGLHIAKCLWGITQISDFRFQISDLKTVEEKVKFLGEAYAKGGQAYEKDEKAKQEIVALNEKIYYQDKTIKKLYQTTRQWSLEYFEKIYQRVGARFDRLYFESEVFKRGQEIVAEFVKKEIFKQSQGAVIFEGSKYGLHDRVFLTSEGFPTYEAKDLALAELQFKEYKPDKIYHVVAKEQSEYFKVLFKALEFTLPQSKGREEHLIYGWVQLKEGKMSSRTGQVVLGEWLLDEVEKKILEIMKDRDLKNKKEIIKKIALAAVKYSMLKTGIQNDIAFDIKESVSLSGDSGPYLLYIVARINSILKKIRNPKSEIRNKFKIQNSKFKKISNISPYGGSPEGRQYPISSNIEKQLLLKLAVFPDIIQQSTATNDPSHLAKYLYELAKAFSDFYEKCPVLKAESEELKTARLEMVRAVKTVMGQGLGLLGMPVVKEM